MGRRTEPRDAKPLYGRVHDTLVERIRSGAWRPGQLIPNEFEVAAEFGVSQGTARKALDVLAAEGLVVRRQGKGTYVVEHTPAQVLFRFFQLQDKAGRPITPFSPAAAAAGGVATRNERIALSLEPGARVVRITRSRFDGKLPIMVETIVLPDELFPGLAGRSDVPNTLYDLFQKRYGQLVTRADERLTPVTADAATAAALGIAVGTPLLKIDRIAFGLDDRRLEWRVSLCHVRGGHYLARLK
jgi:GntR family transcriptional regulator